MLNYKLTSTHKAAVALSDTQEDPMAINDIRDDLRQECEKFGVVKKILLFDVKKLSRYKLL